MDDYTNRRNYKQLTDKQLTRLAQQRNNQAFNILLGRYRSQINNYLLCLIADPDTAEDILQDSLLKAYTSIHQYRGDASFKNWVFIIARNTWKNYLRSRQHQIHSDRFEDIYSLDMVDEQSPEKVLIKQQQSKLLRIAIDNLPTKQRKTLSLRIDRQLPFTRIANAMQCSLSTAKSNHYYGVKAVGRMMAA